MPLSLALRGRLVCSAPHRRRSVGAWLVSLVGLVAVAALVWPPSAWGGGASDDPGLPPAAAATDGAEVPAKVGRAFAPTEAVSLPVPRASKDGEAASGRPAGALSALLREARGQSGEAEAGSSTGRADEVPALGNIALWTGVIALLAVVIGWVLRRVRGPDRPRSTTRMRLEGTIRLGDRRTIHALRLPDRILIVGASSEGLSALTEIPLSPGGDALGVEGGDLESGSAWEDVRSGTRERPVRSGLASAPATGEAPRPRAEDPSSAPRAAAPPPPLAPASFAEVLRRVRGGTWIAGLVLALGLGAAQIASAQTAPIDPVPAATAPAADAPSGVAPGARPAGAKRNGAFGARLGPLRLSLAIGGEGGAEGKTGGAPGGGAVGDAADQDYSAALKIALLVTALSLLPAAIVTMTAFTRTVIVLGFLRTALGTPNLPPNQVLMGLALFITTFVMAPTVGQVYDGAVAPHLRGEITFKEAASRAKLPLLHFMLRSTREPDLALFANVAGVTPQRVEDLPLRVAVPAFVISELKTAFQMGFVIFLPFLVVDLVVTAVLLSMGMVMLSPIMVSTPLKVMLFVLVDGWHLLAAALLRYSVGG